MIQRANIMEAGGGGIQQRLRKGGALSRYRSAITGTKGMLTFLFYECFVVFVSPLPGPLGTFARRLVMPLFFHSFGRGVTIQGNVTFRRPHRISIGDNAVIKGGVTIDVKTEAGYIKIGDHVQIAKDTILSCPGGILTIGSETRIGCKCRLGSLQGLTIGQSVVIGDRVCIVGAGHEYSSVVIPIIQQPLSCKGETVIEGHVQLEQEVTVLDGVHIGQHARVASGSLVNRNVKSNTTVAGVPAISC